MSALLRSNTAHTISEVHMMSAALRSNTMATISEVNDTIQDDALQFRLVERLREEGAESIHENKFISWDGPDDPENPQNWPLAKKWALTMVCAMVTLNVTFASSEPSAVTEKIVEDLDISTEVSYLVTSLFLVGYVFGPIFWGSGSELFGRRPMLILTLSSYTLFTLGQALGKNIQTVLITRFFSGFFAVAPIVVGGGLIADIWPAAGRGPATTMFSACVSLGPCLGPVIGGFIADSYLGWRWAFWVMMIFAGTCTLILIVVLPETYAPVILLKKTRRLRKEDPLRYGDIQAEHEARDHSFKGLVSVVIYRPFKMLSLEPILVLITVYLSIVYGVLYALFEAFPLIFVGTYNFTGSQSGLIFVGAGVGAVLAALSNMYFGRSYAALSVKWRGFPPPEERLYGAMLGAPSLVVGSLWVGWSGTYSSVPWYVPAIGTVAIGTGINLIFMSFLSYLVDTYLMFSASAFASNTICRSLVGAAFPLFTVQMYDKLGINWASTLLGLVALLFVPSPFLFYKYGAQIRMRSKFAPCLDLKIKAEVEAEEKQLSGHAVNSV